MYNMSQYLSATICQFRYDIIRPFQLMYYSQI